MGILLLSGLYVTSLFNYLLFHSLEEMFTIVVAAGKQLEKYHCRGPASMLK